MKYVYVLISKKDLSLYIGTCSDIKKRTARHDAGYVRSTKNRRPLKLIYYECYISNLDATKREKFLKGGKGHDELKIQLRNTFNREKYKYP